MDIQCTRDEADRVQIARCREALGVTASPLAELSQVLALAGNEVRLKILYLLELETELCPCDFADILGMSVPAVSQHLRKMKDAGLIIPRRDGQTIYYSVVWLKADILNETFNRLKKIKKVA